MLQTHGSHPFNGNFPESPEVGIPRWVWFPTRANRGVSTSGLFTFGDYIAMPEKVVELPHLEELRPDIRAVTDIGIRISEGGMLTIQMIYGENRGTSNWFRLSRTQMHALKRILDIILTEES